MGDARALAGQAEVAARAAEFDGADSLLALGCMGCHGEAGTGPPLSGLAGSRVRLASGVTLTADAAYLRRSILRPAADVVAGYAPTMPSYEGQIGAAEVTAIVETLERWPAAATTHDLNGGPP